MKFYSLCLVVTLGLFLTFTPRIAVADTTIAVVDVRRLLTESKAAQSLHKKLQKQRKVFIDEFSKKEQLLRDKEKDLLEKRNSFSQDDFVKKKKEFEEELLKTRAEAQKKKDALDKANARATGVLKEALLKAVKLEADKKGYNLVFSRQNVVVADESIDISDGALKQLNKALSDIPLEIPSK
ncbi:MAG: OmpH family outer membrane protein [Alphaproteobacteria bacterium]|nr:OmpH family outer membrane protein [Alphaproteobacteria bacterium]